MSSFRAIVLNTKRSRAIAIWLTIGLTAGIAALTLIPLEIPTDVPGNDKIHHVLAFTILTLPCAALYPRALLRVVLAAALYGAAIEVIQPYVGRQGESADFFADLLGIGIGTALGLLLNFACRNHILGRPMRT